MKHVIVGVACALALSAAPAFAQGQSGGPKGNGAPKGKFEKFLLVAPGNPDETATDFLNNDSSNGRAIFIPVKTVNAPSSILCAAADGNGGSFIIGDEANTNLLTVEPANGVKINFVKDPLASGLDIVDRDATDGSAQINVPADWANAVSVDLYMRVLGKPGGCIQTDAYTYDGSYYYYAGTAVFKRKTGQSSFVDAGELTNVYYCPDGFAVVPTGGNNYTCSDGVDTVAAVEINVFADVFDGYFWDVTNDGVRVMQVLMRANF